jgi:hypothetical protein
MSTEFTHLFDQKRQFTHFKQLMTGFVSAESGTKKNILRLFFLPLKM